VLDSVRISEANYDGEDVGNLEIGSMVSIHKVD